LAIETVMQNCLRHILDGEAYVTPMKI